MRYLLLLGIFLLTTVAKVVADDGVDIDPVVVVLFMFFGLGLGVIVMQVQSMLLEDIPYTVIIFVVGVLFALSSEKKGQVNVVFYQHPY